MEIKYNPYHTKGSVVFSRFRKFFLGKKVPDLFTRIICNISFLYFFYVFLWALTIFIAFVFGQNLPKAENWNKIFLEVGMKYQLQNVYLDFTMYLITDLLFASLFFVGILLVWRNKLIGYWFSIAGVVVCSTSALVFLGIEYMRNEGAWWEVIMECIVFLLLLLNYFIRKRKKLRT